MAITDGAGKTLCIFIIQVFLDTELFETVEFYLEDALKIAFLV